jgi:predicted nucleic-acid-binding protein
VISQRLLLKCESVLRSRYGLANEAMPGALSGSPDSTEVQVEDEASVEETLDVGKDSGADFANGLIAAKYRVPGGRSTLSFDARAAKLPDFRLA